jgi:hypothetical protein
MGQGSLMALDSALGLPGQRPGVVTSLTRPTNPFVGQMIVETDTGRLMVYTSTGEWRQATTGTEVTATPPAGAVTGDLWFDNESAAMYCYYDGFWVEVTGVASTEVADGQITSAKLASSLKTTSYSKAFYDGSQINDNSSGSATYVAVPDLTASATEYNGTFFWDTTNDEWVLPSDGVYQITFSCITGDTVTYGDLNVQVLAGGSVHGTTMSGFLNNSSITEVWLYEGSANDAVSFQYRGPMLNPRASIVKVSVG